MAAIMEPGELSSSNSVQSRKFLRKQSSNQCCCESDYERNDRGLTSGVVGIQNLQISKTANKTNLQCQ